MKYISILFTLVLSISLSQFAFGDSDKGSKAKGKQSTEHGMLKRGKSKDKVSRGHDDADDDNQKGKEIRDAKRNDRATLAQERNAASQQAKDDYKSAVKNGEAERVKGKKPWWKLWGSDPE